MPKRTFKIDDNTYDVEEQDVDAFLKEAPNAKEYKSFLIGKDTIDVAVGDVELFTKEAPHAKPLYPESEKKKPAGVEPANALLNYGSVGVPGPEVPPSAKSTSSNTSTLPSVSKPITPVENPLPKVESGAPSHILDRYNIKPYATNKLHEDNVNRYYKQLKGSKISNADSIDKYIKSVAPKSPVTANMILASAQKHGVEPEAILAIIQEDSSIGTKGKGARTNNPGNIGNDDEGNIKTFPSVEAGVNAVASWLKNHKVPGFELKPEIVEAISKPSASGMTLEKFNKKYKTNLTEAQITGREPVPTEPLSAIDAANANAYGTIVNMASGILAAPRALTRLMQNPILALAGVPEQSRQNFMDFSEGMHPAKVVLKDLSGQAKQHAEKILKQTQGRKSPDQLWNEGKPLEAAKEMGVGLAAIIPYVAGFQLSAPVAGASMLGESYQNAESIPGAPEQDKQMNAVLHTAVNLGGTAIMKGLVGKGFGQLVSKVGLPEATEVGKKTIATGIKEILKPYMPLTTPVIGYVDGYALQVMNNTVDKYTDPSKADIDVTEGAHESGEMFAALGVASQALGQAGKAYTHVVDKVQRKKAEKLEEKINGVDQDLNNPAVSEQTKDILQDTHTELTLEMNDILEKDRELVESLEPADQKKVQKIQDEVNEKETLLQEPLSDAGKAEIEKQLDELHEKKDKIIKEAQDEQTKPDSVPAADAGTKPTTTNADSGGSTKTSRTTPPPAAGDTGAETGRTGAEDSGAGTEPESGPPALTKAEKREVKKAGMAEGQHFYNALKKYLPEEFKKYDGKPYSEIPKEVKQELVKTRNLAKAGLGRKEMRIYEKFETGFRSVVEQHTDPAVALKAAYKYLQIKVREGEISQDQADVMANTLSSEVSPDRKSNKQFGKAVDASLDVFKANLGKKNLSMTELQGLRKQMSDFSKGLRKGFREAITVDRDYRKQLAGKVKEFMKGAGLEGKLAPRQVNAIVKKAADIKNSRDLIRFEDYAQRVIADANYADGLSDAQAIKKQIAKANKGKDPFRGPLANNRAIVREFLSIDPSSVENVDQYKAIAEQIRDQQKGVKATVIEGESVIKNAGGEFTNEILGKYIEAARKEADLAQRVEIVEQYKDLVEAGIIDARDMTAAEMKQVIDAIEKGDEQVESILSAWDKDEAAQKKKALASFVNYKLLDLETYLSSGEDSFEDLSSRQKRAAKAITTINTEELTPKQLLRLNDVTNNIINNGNFSGIGDVAAISEVQRSVSAFNNAIENQKLGGIKNELLKAVGSKDLLAEFIYRSPKLASLMKMHSGIEGLYNGYAKANALQSRTAKEYEALVKNLNKRTGKDLQTADQRFLRGAYSFLRQFPEGATGEEKVKLFNEGKKQIQQSAERLQGSDITAERNKGLLMQQMYDAVIKDAMNISELEAVLPEGNKQLVDFFTEKFGDRYELLKENTEMYGNEVLERNENYNPISKANYNNKTNTERDVFEDVYFSRNVDTQGASTRTKRNNLLPIDRVLDLDFDKVVFDKYFETNYDIETTPDVFKLKYLLNNDAYNDFFGTSSNRRVVKDRLRKAVLDQKGKVPPMESWERAITKATHSVAATGARLALGSVSQLPKQYLSVAMGTLPNLGKDVGLFAKALKIGTNLPLFEDFNIGNRGLTQAGFQKQAEIKGVEDLDFNKGATHVINEISKFATKRAEFVLQTLTKSDVAVARASWLSYYMQDLRRRGIDVDKIDFTREHERPDLEAAAYAEQMVSRTQNANDPTSLGGIYRQQGLGKSLAAMMLPFSTFNINMRTKMTSDLNIIANGSKVEKQRAARSLTGSLVEQATFNGLKTYMLAPLVAAGGSAILHAAGFDDEEDTKTEREMKKDPKLSESDARAVVKDKKADQDLDKFVTSTIRDFFISGLGTLPEYGIQSGVNSLASMVTGKDLFYQYDPADYGKKDFTPYGTYGVLPSKIYDLATEYDPFLTGQTDLYVKGGSPGEAVTKKVDLTDKERTLLAIAFVVDAAALVGYSDAEFGALNNKVKRGVKREIEQRYGGAEFKTKSPAVIREDNQDLKAALDEAKDDIAIDELSEALGQETLPSSTRRVYQKLKTEKEAQSAKSKLKREKEDIRNKVTPEEMQLRDQVESMSTPQQILFFSALKKRQGDKWRESRRRMQKVGIMSELYTDEGLTNFGKLAKSQDVNLK